LAMAIVFMGGVMGPVLFGRIVDAYHSYRAAWFFLCASRAGAFVVYDLIQETGSTDTGKATIKDTFQMTQLKSYDFHQRLLF
jgi:hypothetical protein